MSEAAQRVRQAPQLLHLGMSVLALFLFLPTFHTLLLVDPVLIYPLWEQFGSCVLYEPYWSIKVLSDHNLGDMAKVVVEVRRQMRMGVTSGHSLSAHQASTRHALLCMTELFFQPVGSAT